jgi:hypothetical protein
VGPHAILALKRRLSQQFVYSQLSTAHQHHGAVRKRQSIRLHTRNATVLNEATSFIAYIRIKLLLRQAETKFTYYRHKYTANTVCSMLEETWQQRPVNTTFLTDCCCHCRQHRKSSALINTCRPLVSSCHCSKSH